MPKAKPPSSEVMKKTVTKRNTFIDAIFNQRKALKVFNII
jgi:hypothetical protein